MVKKWNLTLAIWAQFLQGITGGQLETNRQSGLSSHTNMSRLDMYEKRDSLNRASLKAAESLRRLLLLRSIRLNGTGI